MTSTNVDPNKQFDTAIDISKQLLTLATAVITLTITFLKDVLGTATHFDKIVLGIAWISFFISVLGGVWLLYAANGSISSAKSEAGGSIYDLNTTIPMALQQLFFVVGLALTGLFGLKLI